MLATMHKAIGVPRYGGLVWTLVRTDFKSRYHGTLGGFVWALLRPIMMFVVLLTVFSFIFSADPNYRFNLIIGLFLYDFFSDSTKVGMTSLFVKGFLLKKARTPLWIIVVTSLSNALITLTVFTVIILTFVATFTGSLSAAGAVLFIWYLLHYFLIVTGIVLASSVLFLRYRDLNQIWDVVIQAGFFLAPTIYPLEIIPERFHAAMYLWPPTPFIQFSRSVLVLGEIPTARAHLFLTLGTAMIFAIGVLIFSRHRRRAAEYL